MAFNIPILVIALVSETLKRERIRSMMQEINAKNWEFVDGIDGKKLEKKSGRVTRKSGGVVHVSWTDGGERISRHFSFGRSLERGLINIWGMVGCCLSHARAMQTIRDKKLGITMILESDAVLAVGAAEFRKIMQTALNALPSNWLTLQLGCRPVGVAKSKRARIKYLDKRPDTFVLCYNGKYFVGIGVDAISTCVLVIVLRLSMIISKI